MNAIDSDADSLCTTFTSDDLPEVTKLLKQVEPFKDGIDLFQVRLILDANVVMRSLRWMCKKRDNPKARTEIIELLECKVVEGYAPTFLITEIEKNIPEICAKQKIDEQVMRSRWEQIRERIKFIDAGGPGDPNDKSLIDPKDLPYIRLQEKLNAPILSDDGHIERMGGKAVRIEILSPLRAYSRKTAIEYNLKVVGVGSCLVIVALATTLAAGIKTTASKLSRIPKPLLFLGVLLVVVALLRPTSRKAITKTIKALFSGGRQAIAFAIEKTTPLIRSHYKAKAQATEDLRAFTSRLGPQTQTTI